MAQREGRSPRTRAQGLGYQPFKALKRGARGRRSAAARAAPAVDIEPEDEADLFRREMANVVPLDRAKRQRVATPPPGDSKRRPQAAEAEVLAQLADLVAGRIAFDTADSDEYLEGAVWGLDLRVLRRLRRGEFAAQAHLDLHGMTAKEARAEVDHFLLDGYRAGHRCVLLVHGKGHNSKDQIPILKTRLKTWLARGQASRLVLAFTSARSCDGGTGALYVLLRRKRVSKQKIEVIEGAKR